MRVWVCPALKKVLRVFVSERSRVSSGSCSVAEICSGPPWFCISVLMFRL